MDIYIYKDICAYLNGMQHVSISCIKRGGNMVAHSLAKYAKNITDIIYWVEDSPPPAVEALYQDSLHIIEWMNEYFVFKKKESKTFIREIIL